MELFRQPQMDFWGRGVKRPDIQTLSKDQVLGCVKVFDFLQSETATYVNSYENQPLQGSKAQLEIETSSRPESSVTAIVHGSYLLEVAADQLMAFVKVCTEPVETIAPWTCVRSMLEACAIGIWLVDPDIDARTRMGRSFALRYEGLNQQVKFFRTSNNTEARKVQLRIESVEDLAAELGFGKLVDSKGKRIGIGKVMPSVTNLIKVVLHEEGFYRLVSAVAHAHFWALRHLSFRIIDDADVKSNSIYYDHATIKSLTKDLDPVNLVWLCQIVAKNFSSFLRTEAVFFGWDLVRMDELITYVYRELKISDNQQ